MKNNQQIVALSSSQDRHLAFVQEHLERSLYVIDPQRLPSGTTLSYESGKGGKVVVFDGVPLNNVSGVWYRKPGRITAEQLPVADSYKNYSARAINGHFRLLYSAFQTATWVSDYHAIERASNKLLQLEMATRLGFHVPETLVTSDPSAARRFIEKQQRTIVKPTAFESPVVNGVHKTFFATLLDKNKLPDLSKLHLAPAIFQQALSAAFDVRVTVVGNTVFAAAIHIRKQEDSSVRDWRPGQFTDNLDIAAYRLPRAIEKQCVQLVRALGLNFGALDLIMDPKGKLWFIENNPNGQWAFIEKATGQQIGKAMAAFLAS